MLSLYYKFLQEQFFLINSKNDINKLQCIGTYNYMDHGGQLPPRFCRYTTDILCNILLQCYYHLLFFFLLKQ